MKELIVGHTEVKTGIFIIGTIVFYFIYYYLFCDFIADRLFRDNSDNTLIKKFLFKKFSGFFILGIIPLFIFSLMVQDNVWLLLGLTTGSFMNNYLIIAGMSLVVFLFVFLINRTSGTPEDKPQLRIKKWTYGLFLLNALGWTVYLTGYEILFRGILLLSCYQSVGLLIAVAINISIYSAIHMVNSKAEAIGALIFGFVVCVLTIHSGTVLIAIAMHLVLAISTEFFAIKYRHDMCFAIKL